MKTRSSPFITVLILAAAIALWIFDASRQGDPTHPTAQRGKQRQETQAPPTPGKAAHTGGYETYRGCRLADNRSNDGDSFLVKLPDGRTKIIRLYFADCPESAFRTYRGGENNHARIADQAAEMGKITSAQAVDIGGKAKHYTLALLGKAPFTLHTKWDSPFHDDRYHGFIETGGKGKTRFLHELLIEKGYARIHTKGAQLPGGTPVRKQRSHLHDLERAAKSKKTGVWAF